MRSPLVPLLAVLCLIVVAALALVPATLPGPGAGQAGGFERRVQAYLMSHPEVILEAVSALERRNTANRADSQRAAVRDNRAALEASPGLPVAGNPEGDVTLVEFFDYRCPYCKQSLKEVQALITADPKVRVVFKEFPVLGDDSVFAARVAVASTFQGKYLAFHDVLMGHKGDFSEATVMALAAQSGLDVAKLRTDMARPEVARVINGSLTLAHRIGVNATPTFVVGDTLVAGYLPVAQLESLVSRARAAR